MICLCCSKAIRDSASDYERNVGWHISCIRKFFGTDKLPELSISDSTIKQLAIESTSKGMTVPGVQKKLSLHLSTEDKDKPRLTLVNYPAGYILKPQTEEYRCLPEAEYLAMHMADITKIRTVPFALIRTSDTGEFAYITKRIDRVKKGNVTEKLAMEDFCQLDNRLTADKYKGSYERCAKIIERYSDRLGFDMSEFFMRLVFSFAVGNSDMHLKNFSLIEDISGSGSYHLSPAYDMLPVNVIMPQDTEQLALTLNDKKRNIRRNDFLILAEKSGINKKSAEKIIDKIASLKDEYITLCRSSYLPEDMKNTLENLILSRIAVF